MQEREAMTQKMSAIEIAKTLAQGQPAYPETHLAKAFIELLARNEKLEKVATAADVYFEMRGKKGIPTGKIYENRDALLHAIAELKELNQEAT